MIKMLNLHLCKLSVGSKKPALSNEAYVNANGEKGCTPQDQLTYLDNKKRSPTFSANTAVRRLKN